MSKSWIEMSLKIPSLGVDLVCDCLNGMGCSGVIVEEKKLDTFAPPHHELERDQEYSIRAFFPEPENIDRLRGEIERHLLEISSFIPGWVPAAMELKSLAEDNWAEDWKQNFHSFRVGGHLVFKPTWEKSPVSDKDIVINIDPGMAFGTGTHPSTRLCLESLNRILEDGCSLGNVLDVGTGSGILSMAAAALGAERVFGCDVDETACEVARRNIAMNGMENNIEVSARLVAEIEDTFDVVVANILAEENVRLGPDLFRCLKKDGWLILSGILGEKEPLIESGFSSFSLTPPRITRQEDWSCFVFQKKA
jgi:ribosomal protein L11 methyltransferase